MTRPSLRVWVERVLQEASKLCVVLETRTITTETSKNQPKLRNSESRIGNRF